MGFIFNQFIIRYNNLTDREYELMEQAWLNGYNRGYDDGYDEGYDVAYEA